MEFETVCEMVLRKVTPSERIRRKIHKISDRLIRKIREEAVNLGVKIKPLLVGSVAKDTWIATKPDIDIFMAFPKTYSKKEIGEIGLRIARKVTGGKGEELYAEHPYLRAEIEGFQVDFVPCFEIRDAKELISPVDRTPLHTLYIKEHLDEFLKREVRLLKQFLIGINAYGAEIRVGGFSGYLCELLILHYSSFRNLLEKCIKWKSHHVIDIARHHPDVKKIREVFREPLVVIDPVDPKRNASAALSLQKIAEFKAAAKAFLEEPSYSFFFPKEITPFDSKELKRIVQKKGTDTLFLLFKTPEVPQDVLWGQLHKSITALKNFFESKEFKIINRDVWSGAEKTVLVFEFESITLPKAYKHLGPPAGSREQRSFLRKYVKSENCLSGPRLEGGRWIVELPRRYTRADDLLNHALRVELNSLGLGKYVANRISEGFELLLNVEISDFYAKNPDFARFLTKYYLGRPSWLS